MKILINGMLGSGNLGDDLISYCLAKKVRDDNVNAQIFMFTGNEKASLFNLTDNIKLVRKSNNKLTYKNLNLKINEIITINSADKILIGGGGLLQDVHSVSNINYWINNISATSDNFLVGMGVGPINKKSNKDLLRAILPYFQTQVRDTYSGDIINNLGFNYNISTDIVAGSDLSIMFTKKKSDMDGNILGIAIRPWENINNKKIIQIINNTIGQKNIKKIYLFTFEYGRNNLEEYDYNSYLREKIDLDIRKITKFTYNKDEWNIVKDALEKVDYGIASRLHANVIWQKLNIPVIPISYDEKVNSLYKNYSINDVRKEVYSKNNFITIDMNDSYKLPDLSMKTENPKLSSRIKLNILKYKHFVYQSFNSVKIRMFK